MRRDRPRDEAIADAAQTFATHLEARVRAHPELWYHFYRYWDAQRAATDHGGGGKSEEEDRSRKSEVRSQKSEVRSQKSEVRMSS